MNLIETKNLTKYYSRGKVIGIKDLNLEIEEGEIFGFIGPNGAGKSTTIRLLLDLIRPSSGSGQVFGLDINQKSVQIRRGIGFLPGEIFLQENMTGQECVDFYSGFKEKIDKNYLKVLLRRFELNLSKRVSAYSKGNKQKLAIVLALMHKPKLLILDEPTSGLDPINQQEFYNTILETKKWGTTTFFSTHILTEAEKICDRVGIIKSGKLLKIENIEDFKEKNIRTIFVETKESIPLSALKSAGLKKIGRTTNGYKFVTAGPNGEIIKALAKFNITDFKITEPSLEEIFLHFYK
ncbi:MAG: ABC transporter ATP-binding protein [Patescibacteria group bacterium]